MFDPSRTAAPLVEAYFGVPIKTEQTHGPEPGTIEWLLNAVERHTSAEADALAQYEQLAQASGDPVVALVMRLILDDEERHHGLLKRIEASLRDALEWTHSPTALPGAASPEQPLAVDLPEVARALVAEEKTGVRILRELAEREKQISGGLHSLLLEMMAMDSEKHARMLHFVEVRLMARPRAAAEASD